MSNEDTFQICSDQNGELLCLDPASTDLQTARSDAIKIYYDSGIVLPNNTLTYANFWDHHQMKPVLQEAGERVFWEGGIVRQVGRFAKVSREDELPDEPRAAIIHRREERVSYLLREFLKDYEEQRLFPPTESLRLLLGRVAANPTMNVFYEWPLIGAAKLFEAEEICLGSESPECGFELTAAQQFRAEHGAALADRFAPHLKESAHFPNRSTVVEAWGEHLLSKPALLKEMLAENPSLAAEAVFKIVEKGMFDPRYFPKMSLEEEAKLTAALKVLLTRHRDQLYHQMERTQPVMQSFRWEAYQHFSRSLAKRFSQNVFPSSAQRDW